MLDVPEIKTNMVPSEDGWLVRVPFGLFPHVSQQRMEIFRWLMRNNISAKVHDDWWENCFVIEISEEQDAVMMVLRW